AGVQSCGDGKTVSLAKAPVRTKVYISIKASRLQENGRIVIPVVGVPNDQTDPVGPSGNNICGSIHHFGVPSHVDDRSPRIVYLVAGKQLWIVRLAGGVISIVFDVPHGNGNIGIGDHCKVDLFSGGEVGEQEGEDITGDALP